MGAVAALVAAPWWPKPVERVVRDLASSAIYWKERRMLEVMEERTVVLHYLDHIQVPRFCSIIADLKDPYEGVTMDYQTECRSCQAAIRWVKTQKNKRMPLDPEPTKDGCWVIEGDAELNPPLAIRLDNDAAARYTDEKYTSHFETCPDAKRWSRRGKK